MFKFVIPLGLGHVIPAYKDKYICVKSFQDPV